MAIDRWFFPTNIENLKAILTYGLICGPAGYKKYYTDISSDYPGFIPFFRAGMGGFSDELKRAAEEDPEVIACLIEINLNAIISGNVYLLDEEQIDIKQLQDSTMDDRHDEFLIPSPLPLSCIKQVLFNNKEDIKTFNDEIKSYGNLPQVLPKLTATPKSDKKFFTSGKGTRDVSEIGQSVSSEHPAHKQEIIFEVDYEKVYSLGGLICTLFYFAKNGPSTNDKLEQCIRLEKIDNSDNELFRCINNYFNDNNSYEAQNNPTFTILNHVLGILVKKKKDEFITLIVNFLQSDDCFEKIDERKRANELSSRLSDFFHKKIDAKASDIFAKSGSRIEKMLLLMAHRDDVYGLMKADIAQLDVFDESDYIVAAMLFGVRSKYNKMPNFLRQYSGVHEYISYLMAQYTHNNANTGIKFKTTPAPPTVTNMVNPRRRAKSKRLGFIDWFSNKLAIQHCFKTIMPNEKFDNDKGESTYEGVVLPEITIKEPDYFMQMSRIEIDDRLYNAISKHFKTA